LKKISTRWQEPNELHYNPALGGFLTSTWDAMLASAAGVHASVGGSVKEYIYREDGQSVTVVGPRQLSASISRMSTEAYAKASLNVVAEPGLRLPDAREVLGVSADSYCRAGPVARRGMIRTMIEPRACGPLWSPRQLKDPMGNTYIKPKRGSGTGEPTNININNLPGGGE